MAHDDSSVPSAADKADREELAATYRDQIRVLGEVIVRLRAAGLHELAGACERDRDRRRRELADLTSAPLLPGGRFVKD